MADLEHTRQAFEDHCWQHYMAERERRDIPGDVPDAFPTREQLFWRMPDGRYGVLMFNAAWLAWCWAMGDSWQPIETAPEETEVLIGRFVDGEFQWGRSEMFYEQANEFAGETWSGWVWSEDDCSSSVAEDPAYWRPLPSAPTACTTPAQQEAPAAPEQQERHPVVMDEWMERLISDGTTPPGFKHGEAVMVTAEQIAMRRDQVQAAQQECRP